MCYNKKNQGDYSYHDHRLLLEMGGGEYPRLRYLEGQALLLQIGDDNSCLEGQGDLLSILIKLIGHVVSPVIPSTELLTKSP